MRKFDLAIFDFDGTLADSFGWFTSVLNDLAQAHGFKTLSAAEREALRGATSREILKGFGLPLWRVPAVAKDVRARKAAVADQIRLFDGVPEALSALKAKGVTLAIVSSDGEPSIRTTLGESAALISHWACGADLFGKPAKFKRVCKLAAVPLDRTICIGDEDRDALAAKKAGIAFAAVSWGFASRDALASRRPDYLLDSVAELVGLAG